MSSKLNWLVDRTPTFGSAGPRLHGRDSCALNPSCVSNFGDVKGNLSCIDRRAHHDHAAALRRWRRLIWTYIMRAQRRLMVMVSLDVKDFTRLVQEDERAILGELAVIRRNLVDATLKLRSGRIFKTMGDGALIEFASIEDAVSWTIEFQEAMATRNKGRSSPPILIRAGIALADVLVGAEDRFGAAVAFVVRLQEVAPPGGIAMTHSVRWQLGKALVTRFTRTMKKLKSMDEPMEVWIWAPGLGAELGSEEAEGAWHVERQPDLPSIVVLRFENLSGDPSVEAVIDGVVEEITAALSRVRDFTVIARNSAYAYKSRPVDLGEISRVLRARYVLEGSVRKSGNRVRITAQLIDAADATHLWAERYDGDLTDIFDLEDRIAQGVTGALHPFIRNSEILLAKRKRPENVAAYDLVMRALPKLWAHRKTENASAIAVLREALKLDPHYARAAAFAAWAHAQQVCYQWTTDYAWERAEGQRLIDAASEGVRDDPTALTALATAIMLLFADLDRAKAFVERALALDPNHAWAWTRIGFLNVYSGDPEAGRLCFERAIRLSPLDPFSFNCFVGLGLASFGAGKPAEAVSWTWRAIDQKPGVTWMFRDLATFLAHAGQLEAARAALAKLVASRPHLNLREVADCLQFMEPKLQARYIEGLRMAGLPD